MDRDYTLPPLRGPRPTAVLNGSLVSTPAVDAGVGVGPQTQGQSAGGLEEKERLRAERRLALQREAEQMREMLAAKERELMEL